MILVELLLFNSQASSESKPFADKKAVLQISDLNPFKQILVLTVANNLIKYYGTDKAVNAQLTGVSSYPSLQPTYIY